jgi:hypothetical protein
MGAPTIDYDRFAARWDSDPILQQLVDRFDAAGVVLKTANKENNVSRGQAQPGQIEKMAKRATKLGK